jgi:hypothetical protein
MAGDEERSRAELEVFAYRWQLTEHVMTDNDIAGELHPLGLVKDPGFE